MRISDWSSDVCSSDLHQGVPLRAAAPAGAEPVSRQVEPERLQLGDLLAPLGALLGLQHEAAALVEVDEVGAVGPLDAAHLHPPLEDVGVALLGLDRRLGLRRADEVAKLGQRSEEHTSELQSLMRTS